MSASAPFEIGKFYTHRNMIDACFRVLAMWHFHDGNIGLSVEWWCKRGFPFGLMECITVADPENYTEIVLYSKDKEGLCQTQLVSPAASASMSSRVGSFPCQTERS